MIFPKAKRLLCDRYFSFPEKISVAVSCDVLEDKSIPLTVFGETKENGNLKLCLELKPELAEDGCEAYEIKLCEQDASLTCKVLSSGDEGFIRALFAIKRMLFTIYETVKQC